MAAAFSCRGAINARAQFDAVVLPRAARRALYAAAFGSSHLLRCIFVCVLDYMARGRCAARRVCAPFGVAWRSGFGVRALARARAWCALRAALRCGGMSSLSCVWRGGVLVLACLVAAACAFVLRGMRRCWRRHGRARIWHPHRLSIAHRWFARCIARARLSLSLFLSIHPHQHFWWRLSLSIASARRKTRSIYNKTVRHGAFMRGAFCRRRLLLYQWHLLSAA